MDLYQSVVRTIEHNKLLHPGETVVVAVSGGPDSMALFHMLHRLAPKWRLKLVAAHVDHCFRGEESMRDAGQVRQFASQLGWPFAMKRIDLPAYIASTKENAQAAARKKRYAWLREIGAHYEADCLAFGHHADDQAETVLMRILQGTGITGLAGIPIVRSEGRFRLIRPLLEQRKAQLLDYCRKHDLPYVDDSSNAKTDYVRNRVRLELLPVLEEYNPQVSEALVRLAETASADDDYMAQAARDQLHAIVEREGDACRGQRNSFLSLHSALQRRVITLILRYLSSGEWFGDFAKVEEIRHAIMKDVPPSFSLDLGGGLRFVREYERWRVERIRRGETAVPEFCYRIDRLPCRIEVPEAGVVLHARTEELSSSKADVPDAAGSQAPLPDDGGSQAQRLDHARGHTLRLDGDRLKLPLYVRNRKDGDRMQIAGLNGSKKVKDMFIDAKIPRSLRQRIPIVTDRDGEILWIPGIRHSASAAVSRTARHVVHIDCIPFIT